MNIKEEKEKLLSELNKLKELKAEKFEKYRAKKISQIAKAEMEEETEDEYVVIEEFYNKLDYVINLCYELTNSTWRAIDELYTRQYEHAAAGHLPKLTAGQLEKLLKAAGAENDFQVEKKTVLAGRHIVAEIKQKK